MSKKYITVRYQYGLLSNLTTEEWLNNLENRFPDYELFQVHWVTSYKEAIMKLK